MFNWNLSNDLWKDKEFILQKINNNLSDKEYNDIIGNIDSSIVTKEFIYEAFNVNSKFSVLLLSHPSYSSLLEDADFIKFTFNNLDLFTFLYHNFFEKKLHSAKYDKKSTSYLNKFTDNFNKDFVKYCIDHDMHEIYKYYISDNLKNDRELLLYYLSKYQDSYRHSTFSIPENLKKDEEVIISYLTHFVVYLYGAEQSRELRKIRQNISINKEFFYSFIKSLETVIEEPNNYSFIFNIIPKELLNDFDFLSYMLENIPAGFPIVENQLPEDLYVKYLQNVINNDMPVHVSYEKIKMLSKDIKNQDLLVTLLHKEPDLFSQLPATYRNNFDFLNKLTPKTIFKLLYWSTSCNQKDKNNILKMLSNDLNKTNSFINQEKQIYECVGELKNNIELAFSYLSQRGNIDRIPRELWNNPIFCIKTINSSMDHRAFIQLYSEEIWDNEKVIIAFFSKYHTPESYKSIKNHLPFKVNDYISAHQPINNLYEFFTAAILKNQLDEKIPKNTENIKPKKNKI